MTLIVNTKGIRNAKDRRTIKKRIAAILNKVTEEKLEKIYEYVKYVYIFID